MPHSGGPGPIFLAGKNGSPRKGFKACHDYPRCDAPPRLRTHKTPALCGKQEICQRILWRRSATAPLHPSFLPASTCPLVHLLVPKQELGYQRKLPLFHSAGSANSLVPKLPLGNQRNRRSGALISTVSPSTHPRSLPSPVCFSGCLITFL